MDQSDLNRAEINGAPADLEAFRYLALVNYGHFTSMQVRDRRARGFHLHLERLNRSTQELFGHELDPTIVRDWIRHLLREDLSAVSLRVTVFSRSLHFDALAVPATPDVLITVRAPVVAALTPLRVQSMRYERVLPHIKHIGTLDLFHHTRQAQKNGYDDVIFTTTKDTISEGSIWNVGFFDGSRVVWPSAPMLAGISMQLLCAGLERQGIPWEVRDVRLGDLGSFTSAFTTNSVSVGQPIASIDKHEFVIDHSLTSTLVTCYETNPWEHI